MKGSLLRRVGFFIFFTSLFSLLPVGVGSIPTSFVEAQSSAAQPWMCWHSGPPDESGFGWTHANENLYRQGWGLKQNFSLPYDMVEGALPGGALSVGTIARPFSSVADFVDSSFALDVSMDSKDLQYGCKHFPFYQHLYESWHGVECELQDTETRFRGRQDWHSPGDPVPSDFPWGNLDQYLETRSVAQRDLGRVQSFDGRWIDGDNPGGGTTRSDALFLRDLLSGLSVLELAKISTAGGGNRLLTSVAQFPTISISSNTTVNCGGQSCNSSTTTTSAPSTVDVLIEGAETNNGEEFRNTLEYVWQGTGPGGLTVPEPVSNEALFGSTTLWDRLNADYNAYAFLGQSDTPGSDSIRINLTLDPTYRSDVGWSFEPGGDPRVVRAFGQNPVSLAHYGSVMRFADSIGSSPLLYGYRQPALDRAFWGTNVPSTMTVSGNERVVWPNNFEDLQWFLFEIPGTGDRGSPSWLTFVDPRVLTALAQSGYANTGFSGQFADCSGVQLVEVRSPLGCDSSAIVPGSQDVYPFERANNHTGPTLEHLRVVKQGVARPLGHESNGLRSLNQFSFDVRESDRFGGEPGCGGCSGAAGGFAGVGGAGLQWSCGVNRGGMG